MHAKSVQLDCDRQTIAELLRDAGYTTRAHSSNTGISPSLNFDRGFDYFDGSWRVKQYQDGYTPWAEFLKQDGGVKRNLIRGLWSTLRNRNQLIPSLQLMMQVVFRNHPLGFRLGFDSGAKDALRYVRSTQFDDENEFLFMNLMEAHAPYAPPYEYQTVGKPKIPEPIQWTVNSVTGESPQSQHYYSAYEDSVRYLSDMYESIFAELKTEFDYIITVADHGDLFGEHGSWEHLEGVYPEVTQVPLVISDGSMKRRSVTKRWVSSTFTRPF